MFDAFVFEGLRNFSDTQRCARPAEHPKSPRFVNVSGLLTDIRIVKRSVALYDE